MEVAENTYYYYYYYFLISQFELALALLYNYN